MTGHLDVRDVMEPSPGTLSTSETLGETVRRLDATRSERDPLGVPGMVVVDQFGRLAGVVTHRDVLAAVVPAYLTMVDLSEFTWDDMLEEMAGRATAKPVSDFMTADVPVVQESAPIMEAVDLAVTHDLQAIPVVDERQELCGVIYLRDLYRAVARSLSLFEGGTA